MKTKMLLVLSLLLAVIFSPFSPTAYAAKKKTAPCVKTLAKCPDKGCGGDPELNKQKSRKDSPSPAEDSTIAKIIGLNKTSPNSWKRSNDRQDLTKLGEGTGVVVTGYLIHAKLTGAPESCNCFLTGLANNDFHLNIVPAKTSTMKQSLVIEMSPVSRNPNWKLPSLQALADTKTYVRVTGWQLLDTQHIHFQSMPRATAWEIHPVTKFEVCQGTKTECDAGNKWKALETL